MLVLAGGLLAAAPLTGSAQGNYQQTHTGQGTFYGYGGGGNCSLPKPSTILTAAMNNADYNTAQACGACIEVTNLNTQKKVVARVDDRCPECAPGDVDLSQEAFAQISPIEAGRIPISWRYVSCTPPSAKLYFKEGSSQWWAGVQVRDHSSPVATLAYRPTSGGAFTTLNREMYNYFIAPSGMGPGPYDIQITDVFGQKMTASGVNLAVTTEIDLGQQFPAVLPAPGSAGGGTTPTPTPTPTPSPTQPATTSISVANDWGQGYCSNVTVTNPNTTPLTWTVSFAVAGTVYTSWNGTVSQSGGTVTASGVSWNQTLQAGANTSFGFCANR
ncbi:expansin EXLX1 family cellulose-binding protein [Roseateles sp. MS654]|uniref:expansin EXLX1 family cellulose-binding protein n=1 Tax=Roseateles sp. MS654 TaxID=3412685 RepID=UPI003C2FF72E